MAEDNRIPEIRAAIADFERYGTNGLRTPGQMLRDVLDILDSAPPAPRVFFPGDEVPAGTYVVNRGGGVIMPGDEPRTVPRPRVYVEVIVPSPEEWQAAVDRAHRARLAEATAQPHLDR